MPPMRTNQQRRDMPWFRNVPTGSQICPPDDVLHNARMPKDPMYFLPTFLAKMGIQCSTPAAIRSGPLLYGRMDKLEIWTVQGSGHDKFLIASLQKNDIIGQSLNIELDLLQLQAGVSWDVLSCPGKTIRHYVPPCWASHMWDFNDTYGLTLEQEAQPWLLPQQINDRFIMEEIASLPNIKPLDLKYTQWCWLFLGVTTLADIVTSEGKAITDWTLMNGSVNPCPSSLLYPNQIWPNTTVWNVFCTLLLQCFTNGTNGTLMLPMSNWYCSRLTQVWNQVYSPATKWVYSFKQGSVHEYAKQCSTQSHHIYSRRSSTIDFPHNAIPISGHFEGRHLLPDSRQQATFIIPEAFPDNLAKKMFRTICGAEFQVDIEDVIYTLWLGDAIICTDGLVTQESGTYGLVILMHLSSPEPTVPYILVDTFLRWQNSLTWTHTNLKLQHYSSESSLLAQSW